MTDVTIHVNTAAGASAPPEALIRAAANAALREGPSGLPVEGAGGRAPTAAGELSITLVPPDAMRRLNREYHQVDDVTDVLAFPLDSPTGWLADVYVCPQVAEASAEELGIDSDEEILRLVIHGVLHLLGHDHPIGEDRYGSAMFELQERLLLDVRDRT